MPQVTEHELEMFQSAMTRLVDQASTLADEIDGITAGGLDSDRVLDRLTRLSTLAWDLARGLLVIADELDAIPRPDVIGVGEGELSDTPIDPEPRA